ncbi:uncharacterized protein I206_101965 [Kwoniella pini CBS 10737]|uniref:Uncharacterized protein n=1 Tax=Kwoniella pini CBS 10737 TaxID=1296096 RepID=A0A1B9HV77_9TREE|nr:uncharacterized protein I206_06944 [Kwoniella pini CBS 10737]OCF47166.1 hypothetical protein I206_06944 [Kwoniella pini CBS 10737]
MSDRPNNNNHSVVSAGQSCQSSEENQQPEIRSWRKMSRQELLTHITDPTLNDLVQRDNFPSGLTPVEHLEACKRATSGGSDQREAYYRLVRLAGNTDSINRSDTQRWSFKSDSEAGSYTVTGPPLTPSNIGKGMGQLLMSSGSRMAGWARSGSGSQNAEEERGEDSAE